MFKSIIVVIRGAGDLATGVALRLFRSGFPIVMTEVAQPTAVRRTVAFCEAVYLTEVSVEGVVARRIESADGIVPALSEGKVPVIVDPAARIVKQLKPRVIVDAIMAKRNLGTTIDDAPIVIGLGPGFTAGIDVHAVIETNRGHNLGRVILDGTAEPNTGLPGEIGGLTVERVLRAPAQGSLIPYRAIGDTVNRGDVIAFVGGEAVIAPCDGMLRGLINENVSIHKGMKIGDIDPRAKREHCLTVSDKSLAIGGGVLEAILMSLHNKEEGDPALHE